MRGSWARKRRWNVIEGVGECLKHPLQVVVYEEKYKLRRRFDAGRRWNDPALKD